MVKQNMELSTCHKHIKKGKKLTSQRTVFKENR
jgi:hypothetical protein